MHTFSYFSKYSRAALMLFLAISMALLIVLGIPNASLPSPKQVVAILVEVFWGIAGTLFSIAFVVLMFQPATRGETKEEKQGLTNWLETMGFVKFVGQVKLTTININKSKEVVYGPKLAKEDSHENEQKMTITFLSEVGEDTFWLSKEPTRNFLNYLIWDFGGRYVMVVHRTNDGYGKPYIRK